ncbi:MAG: pseudouridine synthase [Bacteroidota bacterium]
MENKKRVKAGSASGKSQRDDRKPIKVKQESGLVRLNKYIANAGICSRREADELIRNGEITVNGHVVTELGVKVKQDDVVRHAGKKLVNENKVYVLLNKPKDYITTADDPQKRKTVLDILGNKFRERLYPVGRLDRNTTGLLLLTNDGELTKKLSHPSHKVKKLYHVHLDKPLTQAHIQQIANGITIDNEKVVPDRIAYSNTENKKEVGIELHSGKNRVVRRIFEHLGYKVTKLDRVMFAGLTKKDLPRGKWRILTEKEIKFLQMSG